ncbi:MAG TPA: hypothetical protein D7H92_03785 [Candidatus Poseidoniales archaeon]|nr:MAG TPA: hypothetical protein D7H92_03785 [Candidatus Poseidoniales archaeon]|tara:strand:+ start:5461 stop:6408 length:948 start_codon:yes stop_codon:yes gene_type:complete
MMAKGRKGGTSDSKPSSPDEKSPMPEPDGLGKGKKGSGTKKGGEAGGKQPPVPPTPEQFHNQTLDSNLYRGSRIIVPVDLQIYVVEGQSSTDVYDLTQIFDDEERDRPREGLQQLAEGVHLHWSMPDGLMKGEELHDPDEALAEDVELSEMFSFPHLPDRWLVTRQWKLPSGQNAATAWVIESEKQTVTSLDLWRASSSNVALTALDDGIPGNGDDIGWTGTYHGSQGRFTFHENPGPNVVGPLSYSVAGWYNNANDDPLMCPPETTRGAWMDMMQALGWYVPQSEIVDIVNAKTPKPNPGEVGKNTQGQGPLRK